MTKETIIAQLINKGNTPERAEQIHAEAIQSSNPCFILHHHGIKVSGAYGLPTMLEAVMAKNQPALDHLQALAKSGTPIRIM